MTLSVVGDISTCLLAEKWAGALRDLVIHHPDPRSTVELELTTGSPPRLCFRLDVGFCTVNPAKEMKPLNISTVDLTYFPGNALAQAWVAAAWTGYMAHESLEHVSVNGRRPIDPHGLDIATDKCLRDGLPTTLTPESLLCALRVVMTPEAAVAMVEGVAGELTIARFTDNQSRAIAAEYASGGASTDLSVKYGASVTAIRNCILRSGGKMRSRHETNNVVHRWRKSLADGRRSNWTNLDRVLMRQLKLRHHILPPCEHCGAFYKRPARRGVDRWCGECIGRPGNSQYGYYLLTNYKLSYPDFLKMKEVCGNRCEICRRPPGTHGKGKELHVDHDHVTGRVRGLLCGLCNVALGLVDVTGNWNTCAVLYLAKGQSNV